MSPINEDVQQVRGNYKRSSEVKGGNKLNKHKMDGGGEGRFTGVYHLYTFKSMSYVTPN